MKVVLLIALCLAAVVLGYCLRRWIDYRETLVATEALIHAKQEKFLAVQMDTVLEPPGVIPRGLAKRGDLRLYAQTSKPTFAVAEEVLVRVVLANASPDPIILPSEISVPGCGLRLEVARDGKELLGQLPPDGMGLVHSCQAFQLLPRETYGFVDSISSSDWHGFDLSEPGSYALCASYTVFVGTANSALTTFQRDCYSDERRYAWSGSVTSRPVNFKMVAD